MSVELRRTAAAVSSLAKKEENQMHISVKYYVALIEKTTKNNGRGLKKKLFLIIRIFFRISSARVSFKNS